MSAIIQTALGLQSPSLRFFPEIITAPSFAGGAFLSRQAETAFVAAGWLGMMDRLLAVLSLGAVALIVAAPLWH